MAVLPSSAGPNCMGAFGLMAPGLGLGVPGAPFLATESGLAARGLAFMAPGLSLGLGLALEVTGLALALKALGLVFAALAFNLRLVARVLW